MRHGAHSAMKPVHTDRDQARAGASPPARAEPHPTSGRLGWLRAAVLGADDGIVSTACIILGVAAADASRSAILTAGVAGLVAGAMSMAAGEYVSVSSQRDSERASLAEEQRELEADPAGELDELTRIYVDRGLDQDMARAVAEQLSDGDVLAIHARDELGFIPETRARPLQAAGASALSFSIGGMLPLLAVAWSPSPARLASTAAATIVALAITGWLGARMGHAPPLRATARVVLWGSLAMVVTTAIGAAVGSRL
jgi:vacuolar iron transporter family protein